MFVSGKRTFHLIKKPNFLFRLFPINLDWNSLVKILDNFKIRLPGKMNCIERGLLERETDLLVLRLTECRTARLKVLELKPFLLLP